jgi:DNA modification methylase
MSTKVQTINPVEQIAVSDLRPVETNPRRHSKANVEKIARSIETYGWTTPVLITDEMEVIAGHGRILAAKLRGVESVPCIRLSHLTPELVEAYRIADNRLALDSEWDDELLTSVMAKLHADPEFDMSLTGFDQEEIDGILGFNDPQHNEDETPAVQEVAVSKLGDIWELGDHRLLCGQCEYGFDLQFDLIVTSPPYNQMIDKWEPSGMHKDSRHAGWVDKVRDLAYQDSMPEDQYQSWQKTLLDLWFRSLKDCGSLFYNHKNRYRDKQVISPLTWLPGPFRFRQEIVWSRPGSVTQNARMFLASDERIYWLYKGKDFLMHDPPEIKNWSTVWDINPSSAGHPCAFPVEIPRRAILACTNEGQTVYDPFSGSGTTIIAAHETSRVGYGCEKEPRFVDVAVRRWESFSGNAATLSGDGRTFKELEECRKAENSLK